jgi:hypothetical protein
VLNHQDGDISNLYFRTRTLSENPVAKSSFRWKFDLCFGVFDILVWFLNRILVAAERGLSQTKSAKEAKKPKWDFTFARIALFCPRASLLNLRLQCRLTELVILTTLPLHLNEAYLLI